MKIRACSCLAAVAAVSCVGSAIAQTDPLFLNDGSQFYRIQGGVVTNTWSSQGVWPFVVRSNVEGAPMGGGTGYLWDQVGNIQGNFNEAGNGGNFDAGTDGKNIYITQNFCGSGSMWKLDTNWQNAQQIYNWNSPNGGCGIGVTYDTVNGTLWTSSYSSNMVAQLDGSGNIISQFSVPIGNPAGIAYEKSTDTLWMPNSFSDQIMQFDKSGNLLQTISTGTFFSSTYSAEFGGGVPTPGAAALLGVGGLVASRRRRA